MSIGNQSKLEPLRTRILTQESKKRELGNFPNKLGNVTAPLKTTFELRSQKGSEMAI